MKITTQGIHEDISDEKIRALVGNAIERVFPQKPKWAHPWPPEHMSISVIRKGQGTVEVSFAHGNGTSAFLAGAITGNAISGNRLDRDFTPPRLKTQQSQRGATLIFATQLDLAKTLNTFQRAQDQIIETCNIPGKVGVGRSA